MKRPRLAGADCRTQSQIDLVFSDTRVTLAAGLQRIVAFSRCSIVQCNGFAATSLPGPAICDARCCDAMADDSPVYAVDCSRVRPVAKYCLRRSRATW